MQIITDEDIRSLPDNLTPPLIESVRCHRCFFTDAGVPPCGPPTQRFVFRNIQLTGCRAGGGHYHGVVFDSCEVSSLTGFGSHPQIFWACAFRRITLRGRMPTMIFNRGLLWDQPSPEYDVANQAFYSTCDWALDVSEAKFGTTISLDGIPPELVRRDPRSQYLLSRSMAKEFPLSGGPRDLWHSIAYDVLQGDNSGIVVALGLRSKRFARDLERAESLRAAGLLQ